MMKKWYGLVIFLLVGIHLAECSGTKNMENTETSNQAKETFYEPTSDLKVVEKKQVNTLLIRKA